MRPGTNRQLDVGISVKPARVDVCSSVGELDLSTQPCVLGSELFLALEASVSGTVALNFDWGPDAAEPIAVLDPVRFPGSLRYPLP